MRIRQLLFGHTEEHRFELLTAYYAASRLKDKDRGRRSEGHSVEENCLRDAGWRVDDNLLTRSDVVIEAIREFDWMTPFMTDFWKDIVNR
ncbi:MAG TPA: hypothetical protein VEV41_13200 [Terriglobales bacterium]|nr:hypothetical protein [Terriglobales bacterium]